MPNAEPRFDPVIHQPLHLRICGLLRSADEVAFATVRDTLDVSDATLSKHVKKLVEAGYVTTGKRAAQDRGNARRITWLSLTDAGRAAFDGHVLALQGILDIPGS
ncbi:MAG TPA: transcriptional regulator [Candidatus Corynebacterium avicola]|uniref:Transcriptional regulator n=1 Tax=Candidatus Corynebacterium avicola TaxID=2838527 RepID=A0A9D1RPC1_9CORY|nr:transcriptional regulator [Candidatus Corynebacterium avicola]